MTVRHFNREIINNLTQNKAVLLEQTSRHTAQMVVRNM